MREYLFRGKQIDSGEWVEGSLINRTIGSFIVEDNNISNIVEWLESEVKE